MGLRVRSIKLNNLLHFVSPGCRNPQRGQQMTRYCFGESEEEERSAFEEHLLQCDPCWKEVQRLETSVRLLRVQRSLKRVLWTSRMIGVIGFSGRLSRTLGGHFATLFAACSLYALLFAVSLVFEIAYEYNSLGSRAVTIAAFAIFPAVVLFSLLGFALDWKSTKRDKTRGLWLSILASFVSTAIVVFGASLFLPDRPITLMRVQAYPAQAAYLKDSLYYLPLWVLFALIPFHAVLTFQRELQSGRYRNVLNLLSADFRAFVPPRGCIFLKVWHLGLLLGAAMLASFYLTTNLLDNLRPHPHMALFVSLIQARTLCYFTLGVGLLLWYSHMLNEIKRECLAALSIERPPEPRARTLDTR